MKNTSKERVIWNTSLLIEKNILEIGDGYRAKNSEMGTKGLPFARAGNVNNGFHFENADILDGKNVLKAGNKISQTGDVVFTSKGTVGRFEFVKPRTPKFVYSPQLCYWRVKNSTIINPRFLFYWMQSSEFGDQVYRVKGLTDMADYVSLGEQRRMSIPLPPLPIQQKIASILSAYDDLIENNTRRIAILEEMAQSLYREWFVHFRFSGHEKNKMVESVLGMIPEGWKIKTVGELIEHHIGGGWGQEAANDQYSHAAYVIRGTDIPLARYVAINEVPLRYHKHSNLQSRRLHNKDIVFEVSGGSKGQPVGRSLLVTKKLLNAFGEDLICASFCKLLRVKSEVIAPELFYLHLQEIYNNGHIEQYQVQSTGITNFKFAYFLDNEKLIIPDSHRQQKFLEATTSIFESIQNLGVRNANLRHTRDLLLPKLISGEIDVEGLDIEGDEEIVEAMEKEVVGEMRKVEGLEPALVREQRLWGE